MKWITTRILYSFLFIVFITGWNRSFSQSFAPGFVPEGCSPLLGQFKGPAGYWDFGDGKFVLVGADAGGGKLFGPGRYLVRFKKTLSDTITTIGTIQVYASPVPTFGTVGPASGCAPLTVTFEDLTPAPVGSIITKRTWDFGPTGKETTDPTASYTYTTPGTYTVKLIVETDQGCRGVIEKTKLITVTKPPVLNFSLSKEKACGPFIAEITNTSTGVAAGATYLWQAITPLGDTLVATPNSQGKPRFAAMLEGAYKIRLTVTELLGCKTILEKNNALVISSNGLQAPGFTYTLRPSSVTCSTVEGEFTSSWQSASLAGQKVDWEIVDPAGKTTKLANMQHLTGANKVVFDKAGKWKVRVMASGGTYNCPVTGPFEQTVDVILGTAVPAFIVKDSANCQLPHTVTLDASDSKNAVSYEWHFDNDGVVDATGPVVTQTYTSYGTKPIRLVVRDENGCQRELIKNNTIQLATIVPKLIATPTAGCTNPNGEYLARFFDRSTSVLPITNWKWEFFDQDNQSVGQVEGSDSIIHKNPAFTFHLDTTRQKSSYWARLTVSTANGCTATTTSSTNLVSASTKPKASFTSDPAYGCRHTRVNFTYTGSPTYDSLRWYPRGYGEPHITVLPPATPHIYYDYITTPQVYVPGLIVWNGACSDSTEYSEDNPRDPQFLQLAPQPIFTASTNPCQPSKVVFTDKSLGAQYWRWDFGTEAVANPYPYGQAKRDFSGSVPDELLNPVVNFPPGRYKVSLLTEADNIIYVRDTTGERIKNSHFQLTGQETIYTHNTNGQLLLAGPITTGDSILFVRCSDDYKQEIYIPGPEATEASIASDYQSAAANCAPVGVNFSNSTPDAVSWRWVFGNGETSRLQHPKGIVYKEPGSYTVELEVTTLGNCTFKKTLPDYIVVKGPVANFTYSDPEICLGESIQFKDASTSNEALLYRTWDMGNGVVFSNDPSVITTTPLTDAPTDLTSFSYTYPSLLALPALQKDGIPVTLTVVDVNGCRSTKTVRVRPTRPQADFDMAVTTVDCEAQDVKVNVNDPDKKGFTPFRYTWQVFEKGTTTPIIAQSGPDANGSPTFRLTSKSATEEQAYDIRLLVEDNKYAKSASGQGCSAEITKSVVVKPYLYNVDFSYDKPGICPPFKVQFYDHSAPVADIASWDWDFGDGSPHSNVQHPLKIYQRPNPKGYIIALTVTFKNGCKKMFIHPEPIIIQGIIGAFTIKQLSGSPSKVTGAVITQGANTDYVRGPFTPNDYQVQFDAVIDSADLPQVGYYIWDFGNGTEVTTSPTATRAYTLPDIYTPRLVIVNKIGCRYEAFTDLYVVANSCETPQINPWPKTCIGDTITLTGSAPPKALGKLEVTWKNLTDSVTLFHGTNLTAVPSIELALTHTINVALTVQDSAGCKSYAVKTFEVYPLFYAEAGSPQEICAGAPATLSGSVREGTGNYTFAWSTVSETRTGAITTFTNLPVGENTIRLLVTDNATQCTAVDSVKITVAPPIEVQVSEDTEICSGSSTTLSVKATGGKGTFTYQWKAGLSSDGTPSPISALSAPQASSPTFTMAQTGSSAKSYSYVAAVMDELTCTTTTKEIKVTVTPPLTLDFANPGIICRGKSVQLLGTISGGAGNAANWTYAWSKITGNRNNGEIDNITALNPTVAPTESTTTYRLEVTETVNGLPRCSAYREVTIQLSPLVTVTINPVAAQCYGSTNVPLTATVQGGSGVYAYEWKVLSTTPTSLREANKATAYLEKLEATTELLVTVIDKQAIGPVCPVEARIVVQSVLPVAEAGGAQDVCIGFASQLAGQASQGKAPYRYYWQVVSRPPLRSGEDADGLKDADVQNKAASPSFLATNSPGTYIYELQVEDANGCRSHNSTRATVNVHTLPAAPQLQGPLIYCAGETIRLTAVGIPTSTFRWYSSSTLSHSSELSQGAMYEEKAVQNRTFYVTQLHPVTHCESPAQVVRIQVNPLPGQPVVSSPKPYCQGSVIAPLVAKRTLSNAVVRWYADTDLTQLIHTGDTLRPAMGSEPGWKAFYATQVANGCESASVMVEVSVFPVPPPPAATSPAPYCAGETIMPLTAVGSNLTWYADAALTQKVSQGSQLDATKVLSLGKATFYATQSERGCESAATPVTIEIRPTPTANQPAPITFCFEGEHGEKDDRKYVLDAGTGYATYAWQHNGATTQTVEVNYPGAFQVTLSNVEGCSVSKTFHITEACHWRLYLPNAFTPDNDGKNDTWELFGDFFYDLELTVYDRWGEVVYVATEHSEAWNGTYRGQIVAPGTYIWSLKAKAKLDNAPIQMRGTVSVIR